MAANGESTITPIQWPLILEPSRNISHATICTSSSSSSGFGTYTVVHCSLCGVPNKRKQFVPHLNRYRDLYLELQPPPGRVGLPIRQHIPLHIQYGVALAACCRYYCRAHLLLLLLLLVVVVVAVLLLLMGLQQQEGDLGGYGGRVCYT